MRSKTSIGKARHQNTDWPAQYRALAAHTRSPQLRAFYQAGCVAPDTAMAEVPLVALDFETTGLDPNRHSIVSIGVVPFTLQGIPLAQAWHQLVRPLLPLSRDSVAVHGITHSDLDQAPDLAEVLDTLFGYLNGRIPVVHYRAIERPFLNVALQWRLGEGIRFPVLDTMAIEAHLHPNRHPSRWQRLLGRQPVSIRLADSRGRYGLPHYPSHNALTDALATAELLQAQIQHHFRPDTPIRDLWL
ncbi:3'-5' exonuclease [Marinobacter lutaoensis]|jgi:DNA polymerase-3 subunit epsilon|uniref:DNA polymerase III subunit epsilon n=1 Tax=Marinobacter lutaoensis TaxID=135739 RepID=A0A1V2DV15_9GAMM|nr:3'-5' exonuclease [Marinobacter lutaoensis]MBI44179.1 3'-5' exonuclease [Oceanospirillales bacterium]NVD34167.1 3'-5' exonuclease [Marinobacter lutaoensis]ONF44310.1 DNA polymerase III subunit epsilon [Marinobacter lutaoensis]|tara:strand:- start:1974 stop:2705 length:732 start_codon:yes stop_codon:yes gene_type:complete